MLRGYLVSKAHKNKIPTALPSLTFLIAIILASPDVAVTPGIYMADKKEEVVSVWQVLVTFQ